MAFCCATNKKGVITYNVTYYSFENHHSIAAQRIRRAHVAVFGKSKKSSTAPRAGRRGCSVRAASWQVDLQTAISEGSVDATSPARFLPQLGRGVCTTDARGTCVASFIISLQEGLQHKVATTLCTLDSDSKGSQLDDAAEDWDSRKQRNWLRDISGRLSGTQLSPRFPVTRRTDVRACACGSAADSPASPVALAIL